MTVWKWKNEAFRIPSRQGVSPELWDHRLSFSMRIQTARALC